MNTVRIALANLPTPTSPEGSLDAVVTAIAEAGSNGVLVVCFPECYIPGYRWPHIPSPPPDPKFLEQALNIVADAAKAAGITVILGTERVAEQGLQITCCVFGPDGDVMGWQDKVQLDPSEESIYPSVGTERHLFHAGPLTFGIVICHEGWRYPETVRWAVRNGAQVVFHPHVHVADQGSYRPQTFADPANTFHEKALLCRAAENTCYVASVNAASEGSGTTSAIVAPDGSLLCYQPYGQEGLLVADIDLDLATGLLAHRLRTSPFEPS